MTPDKEQERRLEELISINEEAIRKHVNAYRLKLSEDDIKEEAARAALDQWHDEQENEEG